MLYDFGASLELDVDSGIRAEPVNFYGFSFVIFSDYQTTDHVFTIYVSSIRLALPRNL